MISGRGKTILVTGASSGIGEACAVYMARCGCTVFAGVRREADATRLRQIGGNLQPVLMDVTDTKQVRVAVDFVGEVLGDRGLDGLVNNAGTAMGGPLEFVPPEMLRSLLDLNVAGQQIVTQAFLPLLRRSRGRIVFMSSVSGLVARPFLGPYCASKFALEALADSYRAELARWGIRVCVVEPGSIRTAIWEKGQRQAREVEKVLGEEGCGLYGEAFARHQQMTAYAAKKLAIAPEKVVRCVTHALFSPGPKTRYRVGPGATVDFLLGRYVPDRLRDSILRILSRWLARAGSASKEV